MYSKQLSPPRMSVLFIFLPRRFVQNEILIQWDDGFNDPLPEICTAVITGLKKTWSLGLEWVGEMIEISRRYHTQHKVKRHNI